jgi:hypothetical protein
LCSNLLATKISSNDSTTFRFVLCRIFVCDELNL